MGSFSIGKKNAGAATNIGAGTCAGSSKDTASSRPDLAYYGRSPRDIRYLCTWSMACNPAIWRCLRGQKSQTTRFAPDRADIAIWKTIFTEAKMAAGSVGLIIDGALPDPRHADHRNLQVMHHTHHALASEGNEHRITLPSRQDEIKMYRERIPATLPILAVRNTVLFPSAVEPIIVTRKSSEKLVLRAYDGSSNIGVVSQRELDKDDPEPEDLYRIGTMASIVRLTTMPDGSRQVVLTAKRRFRIEEFVQTEPYLRARVTALREPELNGRDPEVDKMAATVRELAKAIIIASPNMDSDGAQVIDKIESPSFLLAFIASNSDIPVAEKQAMLESNSLVERAQPLIENMQRKLEALKVSLEIRTKLKDEADQQHREFYLRQQLKAIQEELGEEGGSDELEALKERAQQKNLPKHVQKVFDRELTKLKRTHPAAPDYAVTRNYVDWILDLPWTEYTEDQLDIGHAETVLDEDHYGLEKVKKRIVEYLAVLKLKGDMKAPILCFYGPPGVGKTSLGRSIARALGRKFARMSLGGVRDEAEIRGHRRAYVGALPGRILQGLKKAGSSNPVFMLDEIDKVGSSWMGDPSSALLEVLDPEQNTAFSDHYLELDYDLSKVLFIATGNFLDRIPPPLRDRMEIIEITGYTQDEKLQIAKGYLVPRQIERNGLKPEQLTLRDEAISAIIDAYTRESGVRQLERTIGGVARGVAKKVAAKEAEKAVVSQEDLEEYLGARRFYSEVVERTEVPGVATGLAWTPAGGDILFVEASVALGSGKLRLTGKLGDVMKESAHAALSYVRSKAHGLGIPVSAFRKWDLHVHVPSGAVPKDGPSAGVALMTALASIYTQRRVKHDVGMTGEVTLRGLVLPVGGIKEKVLAAKRAGIRKVLLPWKNEKDIKEIRTDALEGLEISYIRRMDEVLSMCLEQNASTDPAVKFAVPDKPVTNGSVSEKEAGRVHAA